MARPRIRPGFRLVFTRELTWLWRRPALLGLSTVMPLALLALLAAIFGAGLPTRLPVAVLDLDGSDLSRSIVRMVDASPDVHVAAEVADLAEGRRLILAGRVGGLLLLPRDLARNVQAGRRPEVVLLYDNQHMTPGSTVSRGVANAVTTAAAGLRVALRTSQGQPAGLAQAATVPIPVQASPLFNPSLNYIHFLLAALIPAILQVFVTATAVYSLGLETRAHLRLRVLRRLGGGLWPAMAGKLLPHTLIFLLVLGISDTVMIGYLGLPVRGDPLLLVLAGLLFILACQLLGSLIMLAAPDLLTGLGLTALIVGPAFGFMGVGFPRIGMNGFAQAWGSLLPGTWYVEARIDQTVRGTPFDLSLRPIAILGLFAVILAILVALRLEARRRAFRRHAALPAPRPALPA